MKECNCIDLLIIPGKLCILGKSRKEFSPIEENGSTIEFTAIKSENVVALFVLLLQLYLSGNKLVLRDTKNLIINILNSSVGMRV